MEPQEDNPVPHGSSAFGRRAPAAPVPHRALQQGRMAVVWRALALTYFVVTSARHLNDPGHWSLLSGVILGTHELGHVLFSIFGEWMAVAGGTLMQLLAPGVIASVLWRQRDRMGAALAVAWIAASLAGVAVYMADASRGELPLVSVGGGEDVTHDWTYLFDSLDLVRSDQVIAARTRGLGWVFLSASLIYGFWLTLRGLTSPVLTAAEEEATSTPSW